MANEALAGHPRQQITEDDIRPLDFEEIKYLPEDRKANYMLLEKLFGNEAWGLVKAWASKSADVAAHSALVSPTWEQTCFNRGMRQAFLEILNMEFSTAMEFRNMVRIAQENEEERELSEDENKHE